MVLQHLHGACSGLTQSMLHLCLKSGTQGKQVENAELQKPKYGNGRRATYRCLVYYWLTTVPFRQRVTVSKRVKHWHNGLQRALTQSLSMTCECSLCCGLIPRPGDYASVCGVVFLLVEPLAKNYDNTSSHSLLRHFMSIELVCNIYPIKTWRHISVCSKILCVISTLYGTSIDDIVHLSQSTTLAKNYDNTSLHSLLRHFMSIESTHCMSWFGSGCHMQ